MLSPLSCYDMAGHFQTIQPLLRAHIAASNCSSGKLSLLFPSFKLKWDHAATPLADALLAWPFESPDQRSPDAPPTLERMQWGQRETESMAEAVSCMRQWVNDDELLVIDVSCEVQRLLLCLLLEWFASHPAVAPVLGDMCRSDVAIGPALMTHDGA